MKRITVAVTGSLAVLACAASIGHAQPNQPPPGANPPADATVSADGTLDGPCYGNGTCDSGLRCDAERNRCVAAPVGTDGGSCYGNGTCNAGLSCDTARNLCIPGAPPAVAPPAAAPSGAGTPATNASPPLTAGEPMIPQNWAVAAKAGILFPGEAYLSYPDAYIDTDMGLVLHGTIDAAVADRLTVGAFLFLAKASAEGDTDFNILTLGGTIKARFPIGNYEIRPGLAVGYQTIDFELASDSSLGFDAGFVCELAIPFRPRTPIVVELSFISQPAGGNDDTEVTFAPVFFLAGGFAFGS